MQMVDVLRHPRARHIVLIRDPLDIHVHVNVTHATPLCKMQLRSHVTIPNTKMFVMHGCCVVMTGAAFRISSDSKLWEDDRGNRFHCTELHGVIHRTTCRHAVFLNDGLQSVH